MLPPFRTQESAPHGQCGRTRGLVHPLAGAPSIRTGRNAMSQVPCICAFPLFRNVSWALPCIITVRVNWDMRCSGRGASAAGMHRPCRHSDASDFDSSPSPKLLTAYKASGTSSLVVAWLTGVPDRRKFRPAKRNNSRPKHEDPALNGKSNRSPVSFPGTDTNRPQSDAAVSCHAAIDDGREG